MIHDLHAVNERAGVSVKLVSSIGIGTVACGVAKGDRTIERAYPRYPTIDDVTMRESDRNCWLDLRPYANTAPYTINETASIQRTYRLFRTLGLRFLCVVNHNNQVVGIITRKDLLPESLTDSLLRGRNAHVMEDDQHEECYQCI